VIVLLAANVVVLGVVVWPMQRSVASSEEGAVAARAELAMARRAEQQAKAQRDSKERASVELQKFYADILPESIAEAGDVTNFFLEKVARGAGVTFRNGEWQEQEIRDSRLTQLGGTVTLTGDYAEIRKFLYDIETAEQFVIVEEVALTSAATAQPTSDIEVSLKVSTYYLSSRQVEARAK
jgi:Tfp pilus assembly protein PilO